MKNIVAVAASLLVLCSATALSIDWQGLPSGGNVEDRRTASAKRCAYIVGELDYGLSSSFSICNPQGAGGSPDPSGGFIPGYLP